MVTDGAFHSKEKSIIYTSSLDGTIRTWDRNRKLWGVGQHQACKDIIQVRDKRSMLSGVTSVGMTTDSKFLVGTALDGSIQGFYMGGTAKRPDIHIQNNHGVGIDGVKIQFFKDDRKFIVRTEQALKIYDIRNYKAPIAAIFDLPTYHPYSKFTLSPNEK